MIESRPKIQNIVSTVDTKCTFNLSIIAKSAMNVEYKPQRFGALIMRIREPRTTALIFKSGKIVVAGAKTEFLSKLSCKKFVKILNKLGYSVKFTNFKIQNIVCSFDVQSKISLEKLHLYYDKLSCYEPELFPGLIFRIKNAVVLLFVSGKIVITGLKDYNEICLLFEHIYPILNKFKK